MHLYDTVENHLMMNFALKINKFGLDEIDNLEPWIREIYISMLENHIKDEEARNKE